MVSGPSSLFSSDGDLEQKCQPSFSSFCFLTEQELLHVLDGARSGGGRKNAVGGPPPAAGEGCGVAAVGRGEGVYSGWGF